VFESPATRLYRLQIVDQAITQHRSRLKDINTALVQNDAVEQARKQVASASAALKPWQVRTRDLDLEMKGLSEKTKIAEDSLYSGRITSPKALEDIQEEIASLKRHQSKLEDSVLDAMMHSDEGQSALDTAQATLDKMLTLHAHLQMTLRAEKERLDGEMPALDAQRKKAAEGIPPEALTAYDALRPKKGGRTVALLDDKSCTACGVEQTLNLVKKAQQEQTLTYCASCGRILAAKP